MTKKSIALLCAFTLILGTFCSCAKSDKADPADIADQVIIGSIYTGNEQDEFVEAIAIKNGIIVYAGNSDGVSAYIDDNTEVLELEAGQMVMAGAIDAHNHAAISWDAQLGAAKIPDGATAEECIEIITTYIEENPDKPYYKANGWYNSAFENNCPTADLLDAIDTDKPIVATSSDGHSVWCNTAMLEMAGITAETENPSGGTIEHYADGTPNGCLRDNAIKLPLAALPARTAEEYIEPIMSAQKEYASIGYIGYNEANINEKSDLHSAPMLEAYEQLDKEDKLLIYTQASYIVTNRDDALDLVDEAIAYKESTKGGNFELTDVKIFMDGVVEGGTAYLSEEYANNKDYYGASSWMTEEDLELLTKIVVKANEAGMTVHFHAIGDQASTNAVNCVEKAYEQLGDKVLECRNVITHLQIVAEDTIDKMAELGMVANINPWCCKYPGFYEETEVVMLGEERASNEYPAKSFIEKGVAVSFGTDYGSSFTYDLVECYHILVTRMSSDDNPDSLLNPSEILTPFETMKLMTSGGAWQMHREDTFGTLEAGQKANLIILNQNLTEIENNAIMNTQVLKTMYDGNWIYSREAE